MFYTVYKVTNKMNGKVYIGCHKTTNLDDGYMGSGKYLKRAINKHGLENFEKEILCVFDNPEEMFAKEAALVTEDFIAEENTYNLRIGGSGGFSFINENITEEQKNKRAKAGRKKANSVLTERYGPDWRKEISALGYKKLCEMRKENPQYLSRFKEDNGFYGKTHTRTTKEKMSKSAKKRYQKEKNPTLGKRWIHSLSLKKSKLIPREEELPTGWEEGRKIKFN